MEQKEPQTATVEKLAYSGAELCAALGLHRITILRLEKRGFLKAVPGIRHKLYAKADVDRFLAGKVVV